MKFAERPDEADPECPGCGSDVAYALVVEVPMGVQFPDDADHAGDRETRRAVNCCADCGTVYDPVLAGD